MRVNELTPVLVTLMPDMLEQGKLYISKEYETAIHLCACGCGIETVTPFDPFTGWTLVERNDDVYSLLPSIGNQNFPCRSHYWVTNNQIEWLT